MPESTRDRIFAFVRDRILAGVPPTAQEVQAHLGFKHISSAQEQLDRLVRDGQLVRLGGGVSRGLRLPAETAPAGAVAHVPILGRVQAGGFNLAEQHIEGYVPMRSKTAARDLFALRVQGESMKGAHILPGDLVIVRRQPDAETGQIVVALVDDEATVKVFKRRGRRIELHPANPAFPVLRPDPERLTLLGRVLEVRRSLS